MRVVYIGSIEFSWYCLNEILEKKLADVVGVFNVHPDFSKNISDYRDQSDLAKKYKIPHFWFKNINENKNVSLIRKLKPDLMLVFGLSQIVKKTLLTLPSIGVLGTHPALLPKNRGRSPIPWSIIKGLKVSGLTFMYLDEGADTGDVVYQMKWKITSKDDAASIYKKMIAVGKIMVNKVLPQIENGTIKIIMQPARSNYWPAREPMDGKIKWSWSLDRIDKLIRATTRPYPGAFCTFGEKKLIIWQARKMHETFPGANGEVVKKKKGGFIVKCRDGAIYVTKWQPRKIKIGDRLL
ncbi:MAG: methionyl-tRNA formyltransferase [Patescibacteria group bacterium]